MTVPLASYLLRLAETSNGGFKRSQLEVLGIPWPPPRGWKRAVVGRRVTLDALEEFARRGCRIPELDDSEDVAAAAAAKY